ncbi:MAG: citryl-CoA lyase [Chthoniobacterales bacterium]
MSEFWKTEISKVSPNEILVRGYPIEQLTRERSFGDVVHLLLTGELPKGNEGRLIEAILVSCCEHSLASPSVDAVRFVASSGVPLQTAVAAGVSAIGDVHGGAMEICAEILRDAVATEKTPESVFAKLKEQKRRLPGYGHPVHTADPRAKVLFELAKEYKISGPHTAFAQLLEEKSEDCVGRKLGINVDGAIAGLLCDMGIDPRLGKAFFIIARAPGFAAHAHEQVTKERPFKAAPHEEITYTGPSRRDVPPKSKEK